MSFVAYKDDAVASMTDLAAERRLLTSICLDSTGQLYWQVCEHISADSLFAEPHRTLFQQIAEAVEQARPMPASTDTEVTDDPVGTAKALRDLHQRRLLFPVADNLWSQIHSGASAADILSKLEEAVSWTRDHLKAQRAVQLLSVGDYLDPVIAKCQRAYELRQKDPNGVLGIPTGISDWDRAMSGIQPGLHLVAAIPGCGKTTLMRQVASYAAMAGYTILFLSCEEDVSMMSLKFLCTNAKPMLRWKDFFDGFEDPSKLRDVAPLVTEKLRSLHLVQGLPTTTLAEIKMKIRMLQSRPGAPQVLLVLDYLQKMARMQRQESDIRMAVGDLLNGLRGMSLELQVPILAISSLARHGYNKPGMHALKETGDAEFDADSVTLMYTDDKKQDVMREGSIVTLLLEKNRFGEAGLTIDLQFVPELGHFRQVSLL